MLYAQPRQRITAVLTGAPTGIAADLRVRIVDPPDVVAVAEVAGVAEGPTGVYTLELDAPATGGSYLVAWRNVATGVETVEELEVAWQTPAALAAPAGPSYTTPDALRAELELDAAALTDATADRLIRDAERRIDRIAGAWAIRLDGRKFAPAELGPTIGARLQDATLILAAAAQRNPGAFTPPAGKSVIGPDFRVMDIAGLPPAGQVALRDAAAILDVANLRTLTARARA